MLVSVEFKYNSRTSTRFVWRVHSVRGEPASATCDCATAAESPGKGPHSCHSRRHGESRDRSPVVAVQPLYVRMRLQRLPASCQADCPGVAEVRDGPGCGIRTTWPASCVLAVTTRPGRTRVTAGMILAGSLVVKALCLAVKAVLAAG